MTFWAGQPSHNGMRCLCDDLADLAYRHDAGLCCEVADATPHRPVDLAAVEPVLCDTAGVVYQCRFL